MGVHEWSYDAEHDPPSASRAARGLDLALANIKIEVELGFDARSGQRGATLSELRRADGVSPTSLHRVRRLRRHLSHGLHHLHPNAEEKSCPASTPDGAGRQRRAGSLRVRRPADRSVMVKDEDVCLHCGLCAERCPTNAWDMQKSVIHTARTGCRGRPDLTQIEEWRAMHTTTL